MDVAIIVCLKSRYRTMKLNPAFDVMDLQKNIYKINHLTTMRYVKAIWAGLPSDITENCWQKCSMLGHPSSERTPVSVSVSLEGVELTEESSNLTGVQSSMFASSLLNTNDNEILESLNISDVSELDVQDFNEFVEASGDSEVFGTAKASMACKEQVTAIRTCLRVVKCQETIYLQLIYHLRTLPRLWKHQSVKKGADRYSVIFQ